MSVAPPVYSIYHLSSKLSSCYCNPGLEQSSTALGVCDPQFISRSTTSNIIYGSSTDISLIWIGQLIFDVFVFLLTLLQTLRIHKEGQRSIMDVFLRDGVSVTIVFPPRLISLNC